MKVAFLILSLLIIFQNNSESCRYPANECEHVCVNGPLGGDCSGLVGSFKQCPTGSWSIRFRQNSSKHLSSYGNLDDNDRK